MKAKLMKATVHKEAVLDSKLCSNRLCIFICLLLLDERALEGQNNNHLESGHSSVAERREKIIKLRVLYELKVEHTTTTVALAI